VGPARDEALAAQAPVVLDMRTDPEVPPISPQIAKNKAAELLPRAGLHSKIDG
jgi:pyruvate dehydrogenase (quinone)